ncbi:MAG: 3-phosphoshikimate 1-carboxyvinyltransferase [Planctomycetes bacterium]|nr:3-phosphoshikimate 1-carboxyvinyltransferase [Planctomycetota bacterium]
MTETIQIQPAGPLRATIRPPGSKSITNRALVCAALAEGTSVLSGALASDDTRVMLDSLAALGIPVTEDARQRTLRVAGCGGKIPAANAELFVGNSGTTMRFLTALVAAGHGRYRLDGVKRMRERPIGDLLATLQQLGVDVSSETANDCPPVLVNARGLPGGLASIRGNISSQFLSGLLMAAPYAEREVQLAVEGVLVSQPYVEMTLAVMRSFGVDVPRAEPALSRFDVPRGKYRGMNYAIEPDASAASYFFAAAAIAGGTVTVSGLSAQSLQGDVALVDVLEQMGCRVERRAHEIAVIGGSLRGVTVNMNAISDTVQTLAAVALFAEGPTVITDVEHIRHKETDRLHAVAVELRKFGATVDERPDGLTITPAKLHGSSLRGAVIDTYDDHRMAMSMSLVGLKVPGVVIRDPACVNKTYPEFFRDLALVSSWQ